MKVTTQRTYLHKACEKLPLLVWGGDKDDLPLADSLHGAAWDYDGVFTARRCECQGHVHAEPQTPLSVRHFHADLGRARLPSTRGSM